MDKFKRIETKLIHAGDPPEPIEGAVTFPVFQSSTFLSEGAKSYDDLKYIRLNNTPNHVSLHRKLAALENAEAALVTASGMAAISTTILALLSTGDHFLAQDCLYGGTHDFFTRDLPALGITFDFVDGNDPRSWKGFLKPQTKLFFVETITNPLLEVADLEAVVSFCKTHNLISVIDNTFASPVNFRPPEWGFDLSIHSGTKYLNGHSDIVAGAVIGKGDLVEKITKKLNHLGGSLDPHACFLLDRGLKTLAVRMRYQNRSAMEIARFLDKYPAVEKVYYPGLDSHPNHERATRLLEGFGAMVSFELKGGSTEADLFMQKLEIPFVAPSLGGVESLITRPSKTSHAGMSPEERGKLGISEGLIRLSVGLEATQDLIDDIKQALGGI
ncbi:MAG: PLP-dependent transferase [Deltaproteobacteria bacterium]|nr:MAG: PLP-dependent transferase [Deltaproteobacteria bacterium]